MATMPVSVTYNGKLKTVTVKVTKPVSVTCSVYVKKPNDVADRRNGQRNLNRITKQSGRNGINNRSRLLRYALGTMLLALCSFLFYCSSAFAEEGLSGWLNLNYSNTEQFEDGKKTGTSDSLFQNYYLRLDKSITPALSYQVYFRTSLTNSHSTDSQGNTTTTYQRVIEPALDISLRNPMYGLSAGYRRQEQWSTAHIIENSRRTNEFYYSRFDITPYKLPSLSLQFDRQSNYDHLSPRSTDNTSTTYTGTSAYSLQYKDLKFTSNIAYTHNINEMPTSVTSKSKNDSFNGSYYFNYNKSFWSGKVNVSSGYQGNYVWNKNEQFITQTGSVAFERTPSLGLYGSGTQLQQTADTLVSTITLSDNIYNTPATTSAGTINIGQNGNKFHNIGIQLFSSEKPVDTLIIYVQNANKNITSDTILTNPNNWKVYRSDFNLPFTWTEITIQTVTLSLFVDPVNNPDNNIYRYEIKFSAPQNHLYFRAINMDNASVSDVLVTEIEAFGTDVIPQSGKLADESTFFTQGVNLNASLRPINNLTFSFNYFINRADQSPKSVLDSIGGIFANMFSKSTTEAEEKLRSNISRNYGASSTWLAHRLLTTTLRFQRSEAFDNRNETDISSNTYSLTFSSSPLPTLETNLSWIKSYSYSFDEKQSQNDLYLLSIGSKLYKDVNMITDLGYTQSKTYPVSLQPSAADGTQPAATSATESSTRYIRGTLDARLTPKLSGNLTYGFSWTSGSTSSSSQEGGVALTYRPGQFINFSGTFKISDADGNTSTTEEFLVDWLPLRVIRLNLNYQHSSTEPESVTTDSLGGYAIWYITKFLDVQLTSTYTRSINEKKTENYSFGGNLTCKFW